jgi:hypothetical protein
MGHPRPGPGSRWRVILTVVLIGTGLGLVIAEIALRAVEATWQSAAPTGVVDSPKALRSRTSAGKRITPNLDVVVRRHPRWRAG